MRVVTVIDSLAVGGAEQSLQMLAPHLIARGVDLHVAYLVERPGVAEALIERGARLHAVAGTGGRAGALARLLRLLRELRPDIVHTTLYEADVLGRTAAAILRIPVVSSFVTEAYGPEHVANPEYAAWKVRAAQLVDAATARFVTRFHAVSVSSADVMASRLRIRRDKITVIPRGRDPKRLGTRSPERRRRIRAGLGIADGSPLIVAAARHYHLKGLDVLVRAFPGVVASFPEATLLIAGREGPATPELRRLITAGGVEQSVVLAGYRSDVPDLMCAADVVVLPSRAEGSPGVLLEAMALEAPTVASDIPSVRELSADGATAALCAVESADDMARAINGLLDDPGAVQRLAAAAQERFVACYTMSAIARETIMLYRSCLPSQSP